MQSWAQRQAEIASLADRQLFFVGGAPRSGTTWLQSMLDAHPDVSCRGEGLFRNDLAAPLERLMADRTRALEAKNTSVFQHDSGYPLPEPDHAEFLLGAAILLALHQQSGGKACRAIGEKTPENVFFFPRLKRLFPTAKLICIARDPRDVLASAWHFFHQATPHPDPVAAKIAFLRGAFPSIAEGARSMLALARQHPADCTIVTYEALRHAPAPELARLFRFLGVSDAEAIVADCLARTEFKVMAGGRAAGQEKSGSFFRKGVAGGWTSTLTQAMNELVLQELGWMFPHFGWQP